MIKINLKTKDGTCPSYEYRPQGAGPWPGVLVFMAGGAARREAEAIRSRHRLLKPCSAGGRAPEQQAAFAPILCQGRRAPELRAGFGKATELLEQIASDARQHGISFLAYRWKSKPSLIA